MSDPLEQFSYDIGRDPVPTQTFRIQHSLGESGWTNLNPDGSQTETYTRIDRAALFRWRVTVGRQVRGPCTVTMSTDEGETWRHPNQGDTTERVVKVWGWRGRAERKADRMLRELAGVTA